MSNQSFFPPNLYIPVTNLCRRRHLVRAIFAGIFFFLARQVYLSTTTTITTTTTTATETRNSFEPELDTQLVKCYSTVFQNLIHDGFLTLHSKTLTVGIPILEFSAALRESGITDAKYTKKNVWLPFRNHTFDFEFSSHTGLDCSQFPGQFASELSRTLKPDGYLVIHTESKDLYSLNSLLDLFDSFKLIRSREISVPHWSIQHVREIVLKKQGILRRRRSVAGECSVPAYKKKLIQNSEPLIPEEPMKPWVSGKRNLKNMKYLPSMADIRFKTGYVYIDVGARGYGSSIGSWFKKVYPKQDKSFKIFAVEADKRFHDEYKSKKRITLLPYAAWVRNESLFFEINRAPNHYNEEKGKGMGRAQSAQTSTYFMGDLNKVQGFDFADWVKKSFRETDFVVVKMDVDGTEFDLMAKMVETGAICLIDEMFLECHYDPKEKCCDIEMDSKYDNGFKDCLELYSSLREKGVLVHQRW
ncbi:putative methyltransferase FkbM, methyltransferase type 11 [Helianthus annuus]|uniref:Methyltransferase FkbM, methyltransferase type 11 n=1 Tax=Helianthus annuus TaxID=4232 RepID=A0A251V092_HELAN|nr:uncharacterized protein LOC110934943 [Helianthus annuus]KAF5809660.1 putative methyltransferase FkbM, methyltransferase type 11 [Helianthus annuus]KAJ0580637.1 putative methyltransferase FkbM, methyltransferase type 11 [Helianthus annuus]KAJ0596591.1 putative methyltransferase FkbM, methyltransferase type 11 [Helianthus annuus]KAJ0757253.1 putative methyltransferase FkbM, methyltransferase type 11 [Helianthus annuus]KAJ0760975.1 putative methyltransferase FkbM, methyltransferase type 11 [He